MLFRSGVVCHISEDFLTGQSVEKRNISVIAVEAIYMTQSAYPRQIHELHHRDTEAGPDTGSARDPSAGGEILYNYIILYI